MSSLPKAQVTSLDGSAESSRLEQDHKREMDQKHKWARGSRISNDNVTRPAKPFSRFSSRERRLLHVQSTKHAGHLPDDVNYSGSSTEEEETLEASAAPEPDAGITYSFDARRGPGHGSELLSFAINKAVERFEAKAVEKLVKDEYEVIRKDGEPARDGYTADVDDEFELV